MPPQTIAVAGGMGDPNLNPPHKSKPGRTRVACSACRANKQKCDAATRHPCRRCELYGLECDLDGTAIKHTTVKKDSSYISNATINENLHDIKERLRRIETAIGRHHGLVSSGESDEEEDDEQTSIIPLPTDKSKEVKAADPTPVQFITETIDKMAFSAKDDLPDWSAGEHPWPENTSFCVLPVSVARGLVTVEDCMAAFTFFQGRIQPWHSVISTGPEFSAVSVHNRSPFLFHVILLVASYYNTTPAPSTEEVYRGLTTIVNEFLVYHIICPIVQQTNIDFIRGLAILLYYKPVQYQGYETWQTNILGSKSELEPGPIAHASKINALSSMFLHGLIYAASQSIGLHRAPAEFMKTISDAPLGASDLPKSTEAIIRLRLWYCVCMGDIQGTLQAGRKSLNDATEALRTTRLFADLHHFPTDARLAANTELYGIVRTSAHTENPQRARLRDLMRIDADFEAWTSYWTPILKNAQRKGDKIAYTSFFVREFIIFTVHAGTFSKWTLERKKSLNAGKNGRPMLRPDDWNSFLRLVESAERFLFMLSMEAVPQADAKRDTDAKKKKKKSDVDDGFTRSVKWAPVSNGVYSPLHLDTDVADDFKTAHDPVNCVMFVYSMILLFQMAGMGLINSQLEIQRLNYEATMYAVDLSTYSQPMLPSGKLHRLLELGADFLERVSPQKSHPCLRQSHLVRMIIRAGLSKNSQYQFNQSGGIVFGNMGGADAPPSGTDSYTAGLTLPEANFPAIAGANLLKDSPSDSDSSNLLNNPGLDNWLFWGGNDPNNSQVAMNVDPPSTQVGSELPLFGNQSYGNINPGSVAASYLNQGQPQQDSKSMWPGGMAIPSQPLESEIASLINVDPYMTNLMSQFTPSNTPGSNQGHTGGSSSSASNPAAPRSTSAPAPEPSLASSTAAAQAKSTSPSMNISWNLNDFQ